MHCVRLVKMLTLLTAFFFLSGCSVYMASNQPDKKDLNVFETGTDRTRVIAELGEPESTKEVEGNIVETYRFIQGYSSGAKAGRAIGHGFADLMTAGLWEVVGTSTEAIADGTEMAFEVTYSPDQRVASVKALSSDGSASYATSSSQILNASARDHEIDLACQLCNDPSLANQSRDMPPTVKLTDIPDGYAVVVGSAYMSSAFDLTIGSQLTVGENMHRYPAGVIFDQVDKEKASFMLTGPSSHIYLVPAGNYRVRQVSGTAYGALDIDADELAKDHKVEGTEAKLTGFLTGVMNATNKINNVAYAPIRGAAKITDKALGGQDPQNVTATQLNEIVLTLPAGEVTYIGHIQLYSLLENNLISEVTINDEFDRAKAELSATYPEFVANLNQRLLHLRMTSQLQ